MDTTITEPDWRHGRWYEPHMAQPDPTRVWTRDTTGRLETACLTCGEYLIGRQVAEPVALF
jgi:hypothetical protein